MKENRSNHYEVNLLLDCARIKHFITPNQPPTFYLTTLHMTLKITLAS